MCRLFIVEDEEIIREGIQKNIDWASHKVEIVGTASNGRECLDKIEACMPEVILSDIKMPFMDGMELIEHIYELYPKIKVVLLTAFDEFEYAKKALNYKVCQYVMKYEENEKILEAVLKAGNEYAMSLDQMERVKQSETLLKNKVLRDLLFYDEKSEENISGYTNKKTVNQIVDYIKDHYQEKNICLDTIAKNVHLTPAYVSAMFKKEKNINISDYIIKIRIERAKYLLMTTDMKTYEISEEIGYVNSQYFSVLFKRNTGLSPTEYRQKASVKID